MFKMLYKRWIEGCVAMAEICEILYLSLFGEKKAKHGED